MYGVSLYVICCFSIAAFNILSLCLVFVSLISMCLIVFSSLSLFCMRLFVLLGLDYFLFHVGEIFNHNLFKIFLIPFLFLFFIWYPYNSNVDVFEFVPEVSETILSSFHFFYLILLFRSYFHHFIFQLTDSFFCFR